MSDDELTVEDMEFMSQFYQLRGLISHINTLVSSDSTDSDSWNALLNYNPPSLSDELANSTNDNDDDEGYYESSNDIDELVEKIEPLTI